MDEKLIVTQISVIIPCYNHGRFIKDAVDSVLNQTFQDFEIIIIDDCSTDEKTTSQIKKVVAKDPRIKAFYLSENVGLPSARNYGIKHAKYEYILPLDSDDKIAPTYLEKTLNTMKNENADVVFSHIQFFGKSNYISRPVKNWKKLMLFGNVIFATALYKKSDWKKYNGYKKQMRDGFEDWEFWLNFIENNKKMIRLDEALFYYRIGDNALSISANKKRKQLVKIIMQNHPSLFTIKNYYLTWQYIKRILTSLRHFILRVNISKNKKIIRFMGVYLLNQKN